MMVLEVGCFCQKVHFWCLAVQGQFGRRIWPIRCSESFRIVHVRLSCQLHWFDSLCGREGPFTGRENICSLLDLVES